MDVVHCDTRTQIKRLIELGYQLYDLRIKQLNYEREVFAFH